MQISVKCEGEGLCLGSLFRGNLHSKPGMTHVTEEKVLEAL